MTGRSRFDPWQRQMDFSSSLCVQTGSGAHPASYTMGTGGSFPGDKARPGVALTTHPYIVPRSRMSRRYTSPPPSAFVACSETASTVFTRVIFALLANFSVKMGGWVRKLCEVFLEDVLEMTFRLG
jgi:hypothetical protein